MDIKNDSSSEINEVEKILIARFTETKNII